MCLHGDVLDEEGSPSELIHRIVNRAASNELIAPVPSKQISICSANASDYDVVLAVGGKIG